MSEKISMGIDLDKRIIEENVTNLVAAAISTALGDKEALVTSVVKNVIASYIDERGELCSKDKWHSKPYLQYLAEKCVMDVMREQVQLAVEQNRASFEEAIKRELAKPAFKKELATSFLSSILDCASRDWKMPVHISFEKPKDN